MAYGIGRKNGTITTPAGFYGYTPVILKVAGTGVGSADTVAGDGTITLGNFSKAIRAIELAASVVYIGTRANNQFVVIIDGPSASAYVSANSDTDVAAAIAARVQSATSVSTTVTDISGLVAGNLA
jgi:hypothetical protein